VNTAATADARDSRRRAPDSSSRPVTDRTPSSPATVAAKVAGCPWWTRKPTRWTVIAAMAAPWATNAMASHQNRASRTAARTTRVRSPGVGGRCVASGRGGLRTAKACSGMVTAPWIAARASRVVRQPYRSSKAPVSGMKIVLANPATTMTPSTAFGRRRASNQETTTARAGS
jgi:hypothetical protein